MISPQTIPSKAVHPITCQKHSSPNLYTAHGNTDWRNSWMNHWFQLVVNAIRFHLRNIAWVTLSFIWVKNSTTKTVVQCCDVQIQLRLFPHSKCKCSQLKVPLQKFNINTNGKLIPMPVCYHVLFLVSPVLHTSPKELFYTGILLPVGFLTVSFFGLQLSKSPPLSPPSKTSQEKKNYRKSLGKTWGSKRYTV